MKTVYILLLFLNALSFSLLGQIEEESESKQLQWYVFFKLGAKHNFTTYQNSNSETERSIKTPDGYQNLMVTSPSEVEINPEGGLKLVDFCLQFPAGFYVVSPYLITSGIEYQPIASRTIYRTKSIDNCGYFYVMDELNTLQTLSFPLFIDTRPLYNKFSFFGGIRFHLCLQNWQLQKVSWNQPTMLRKPDLTSNEFHKTLISYALGFNYSIFSFEFSMHPSLFLNQNFVDDYGKKPYSHLNQSIKSLSASIMLGKLRKKNK